MALRLYKRHLRWTKEFVENNIGTIEQNYSLHPYKNKWKCNVHSVHDYETENVYMIDYKFLRKEYEKVVADAAKKYGIEKYGLGDIWYNYYKKGQYQEPHKHLGPHNDIKAGGFTAVHYMIFDPTYHSATQFTDPNIKPLRVRGGDIIFFPDDVEHYVPENETDKPRLTTAFTVTRFY